jgi:hypothetical protein
MKRVCVAFVLAFCFVQSLSAAEFKAALNIPFRTNCRMETCTKHIIVSSYLLAQSRNVGFMYFIKEYAWTQHYKNGYYDRKPNSISKRYVNNVVVLCSKNDPMVFYKDNGEWDSIHVKPGNENIPTAYEASHLFYYAVCHNLATEYLPKEALARKLGYTFKTVDVMDESENVPHSENLNPFTLMKP